MCERANGGPFPALYGLFICRPLRVGISSRFTNPARAGFAMAVRGGGGLRVAAARHNMLKFILSIHVRASIHTSLNKSLIMKSMQPH